MAIDYGNNELTIVGSGNQFAVVYTAVAPVFPTELAGFASVDSGAVLAIATGGTTNTLVVDNARFVVEYLQRPGLSGNNVVTVNGGNNAFVVAYEPSFVTTGNNKVSVTGNGSRFVVAYRQPATGNAVSLNGDLNQFVVANSLPEADGNPPVTLGTDPTVFSSASRNNSGVIVGTPGSDTVRVDGSGNLFVIQYAAPPGSFPGEWSPFPGTAPVSVAEPSSMALLALGLVVSRLRVQRRGRRES